MPDSKAIKVRGGMLKNMLGMDTTKNADPTLRPDDTSFKDRFSKTESEAIIKSVYVRPSTPAPELNSAGIIPYLKPTHVKVGNKRLNTDKMRALAPEIEQSRILVSSSIMSPNDLQDGSFVFTFDDVLGLSSDEKLCADISKIFDDFFNGVLNLGIKSYDWIGEIQYSSGSKPVLILPSESQTNLRSRTLADVNDDKKTAMDVLPGCSSFNEWDTFATRHVDNGDYFRSRVKCTWKDVLEGRTPQEDIRDMIPMMESFGVPSPFASPEDRMIRHTINEVDYTDPRYLQGLESQVVNLRSKLEEGDVIRISENPEILRFGVQKHLVTKSELAKQTQKAYGTYNQPIVEDTVYLNASGNHTSHPTLIELPPESVIPIYIPGAPSIHHGYFILIDDHGQPLSIEASGLEEGGAGCQAGNPESAYNAIYGNNNSTAFGFTTRNMNDNQKSTQMIFQHMLDKYVGARLKGIYSRDDLSIPNMNALSTVMFYRLLEAKQTTLVYVPTDMLHYFAFDYDTDGTGKARTDELQFLLSLRATYQIASVMAMANDAVEHKTVSVGVDDKNANIEAIMDLVSQIFIAKQKVNGSIDPSEIMRDLYANNLTIVPKNVPGLSDLSVEVGNGGMQSTRPDDALIEQITNLIVSHLDVPPAALNQLSEPEYAKSLVTMNLFFAKKITRYQRQWCKQIREFIADYIHMDGPLQQAILKVLDANRARTVNEQLSDKVLKLKANDPNKYSKSSSTAILQAIMDGFKVSLPSPNIAQDTAQYDVVRNYLSNMDELAERFFPSELIPQDDQAASNGLNIMKAIWKRRQTAKYLNNVGNFSMVDIPEIDDFEGDDVVDLIQTCQNITARLSQHHDVMAEASQDPGESDSYGNDDYDSGDDFGGGDSGMDVGDGDSGDTDFSMPEEPATEEPQSEVQSPAPENTEGNSESEGNPTMAAVLYSDVYRKK